MKINFNYKGKNLILVYDINGNLDYIVNSETNENMILQYTQVGRGYNIEMNNGFLPMMVCNGVYVKIVELDVYVPKYIFIVNTKN